VRQGYRPESTSKYIVDVVDAFAFAEEGEDRFEIDYSNRKSPEDILNHVLSQPQDQ
jgi:hypothetical protein